MNCFQREAQDLNSEIAKEQILSWSTLLSLHQEPYQHCVVGRSEQGQVPWQLKQCWETSWSIFGGLSKEEMIKAIFLDGQINMHIWYMEENDHLGYLYAPNGMTGVFGSLACLKGFFDCWLTNSVLLWEIENWSGLKEETTSENTWLLYTWACILWPFWTPKIMWEGKWF